VCYQVGQLQTNFKKFKLGGLMELCVPWDGSMQCHGEGSVAQIQEIAETEPRFGHKGIKLLEILINWAKSK